MMPVPSAKTNSPESDSAVITRCAGIELGAMLPYPIVASVSTLKKKARQKGAADPLVGSVPDRASTPHAT